jgi:hypothetical protein
MRFEVKGGGIVSILFGIILLSGAVFALGLLAGYDVGRQAQIDSAQLATGYPLQPPAASSAASNQLSPEPANPPVKPGAASASPAPATQSPVTAAASVGTGARNSIDRPGTPPKFEATSARQHVVSAAPLAPKPASSATSEAVDEDTAESDNPETVDESAEAPRDTGLEARHKASSAGALPLHKPYNIQIQAAMDISGADKMMARLQKLGYSAHLVPTEIGGQRWYKVEVGPYATAGQASNAEAELREKYDQTYGGVARGNAGGQTSANEDSEE